MLAGMHGESRDGPAIEFCDVSYELPSGRRLLSDLSLQVQRGETLVFLGRSGSGKTTTLKMINRLLTPTKGEVCVDGATAFFFSSRRRHTSWPRDWSSDVCSSDLP